MRSLPTVAAATLLLTSAWALGRQTSADGPEPVELLRTNDYSEGIVLDHQGNLYFSHGKIITRMRPDGSGPRRRAQAAHSPPLVLIGEFLLVRR